MSVSNRSVLARAQEINQKYMNTSNNSSMRSYNDDDDDVPVDELISDRSGEGGELEAQKNESDRFEQHDETLVNTRSKTQETRVQLEHNNLREANDEGAQDEHPIVTPEMLVDALSGHEDGLLAIAERLMEHYDGGYDVMGEAIIDAFADVQKLFQHVVEAAHMEGAAFESNRAREERERMRINQQNGYNSSIVDVPDGSYEEFPNPSAKLYKSASHDSGNKQNLHNSTSSHGPTRHDEIIDTDVREILRDALTVGNQKLNNREFVEAHSMFENACQSASSLLPVDSDHRGRLQLSIARAESMSPEKGCAILRYAMDDVLRSGLRYNPAQAISQEGRNDYRQPLPSIDDRATMSNSDMNGRETMSQLLTSGSSHRKSLAESIRVDTDHHEGFSVSNKLGYGNEEALASLIEEFKECLSAPMHEKSPLHDIAASVLECPERRKENELARIKGEFLMAKAEWEEKLSEVTGEAEEYKSKYLEAESAKQKSYMDEAKASVSRLPGNLNRDFVDMSPTGRREKASSVASFGSGLAQHAKSVMDSLNCYDRKASHFPPKKGTTSSTTTPS
eukprot:CAMPEP_0116065100 /NCGR_PEP_ID=MMETSP0322-20121206/9523_1 /TAXON_ID=163516 /ORGANISM="Leptocylindrus danicus var. apora, Strain B651" /LENGTH=564 /DNA_ID=CAMNT_0003551273 /DNA_START=124 /DNA_END=1814 /DNA_ORIENTATION=-